MCPNESIWDMKAIITQINEEIGAAGVVSQECKAVVSQYGQQIIDELLAEVCSFLKYGPSNLSHSSFITHRLDMLEICCVLSYPNLFGSWDQKVLLSLLLLYLYNMRKNAEFYLE
jgi:hypothetical protein